MSVVFPVVAAVGALLVYLGATGPQSGSSRVRLFLERLTGDAGLMSWGSRGVVVSSVASGVGCFVAATMITNSAVVLAVALVGGSWMPCSWLRARGRKRRTAHREVWPEAIALLTAGVRAGVSLPEVVASVSDRGPEVLRPFFQRFRSTYRSSASFVVALDRLANDLADPVADRVVAALKLAHEVGGTDLVRVLRTLGDFVRDDLAVRKEVEARWAWTVTAARLAAAAPWLVLVVMSARPEAAAAYDSPSGAMVVAVGAVTTFVGYRLMLQAARLPDER